jgi:peptidoglycan/xylan/chitin deacetylase (PgdA/CDA1 family)
MAATPRYPRVWEWPGKQHVAISINLALEAFQRRSQWGGQSRTANEKDYFSLSYGEYGAKSGGWRLLDLLDELGMHGSMSTNGLAAELYPKVVRAFADQGSEIVGHGWANDELNKDDDPEKELGEIRKCTQALKDASGTQPLGWTSPGSAGSKNTLGFLRGEGYIWNGDDASDDLPFLRDTPKGPMVMMPRTNIPHNDLIMWMQTKSPPSILYDNFKETFDQLYAEGKAGRPKWTEITLHCHIAGRPTLVPTIRKCLEYAKRHENVWFPLKRDIARWALQREGKG